MVNPLVGTSMFLGHEDRNGIAGPKKMSTDAMVYSTSGTAEQTSFPAQSSSASTPAIATSTDETAGDSSGAAEQVAPSPHAAPLDIPPLARSSIWHHGKRVNFSNRPHWLCDHCDVKFKFVRKKGGPQWKFSSHNWAREHLRNEHGIDAGRVASVGTPRDEGDAIVVGGPEVPDASVTAIPASAEERMSVDNVNTAARITAPATSSATPPMSPQLPVSLARKRQRSSIWYHGKRVIFSNRPHWLCDHCDVKFKFVRKKGGPGWKFGSHNWAREHLGIEHGIDPGALGSVATTKDDGGTIVVDGAELPDASVTAMATNEVERMSVGNVNTRARITAPATSGETSSMSAQLPVSSGRKRHRSSSLDVQPLRQAASIGTADDSSGATEQVAPPPHPAPRHKPPLGTSSIWYHGKRVKFSNRPHWLCDHCDVKFKFVRKKGGPHWKFGSHNWAREHLLIEHGIGAGGVASVATPRDEGDTIVVGGPELPGASITAMAASEVERMSVDNVKTAARIPAPATPGATPPMSPQLPLSSARKRQRSSSLDVQPLHQAAPDGNDGRAEPDERSPTRPSSHLDHNNGFVTPGNSIRSHDHYHHHGASHDGITPKAGAYQQISAPSSVTSHDRTHVGDGASGTGARHNAMMASNVRCFQDMLGQVQKQATKSKERQKSLEQSPRYAQLENGMFSGAMKDTQQAGNAAGPTSTSQLLASQDGSGVASSGNEELSTARDASGDPIQPLTPTREDRMAEVQLRREDLVQKLEAAKALNEELRTAEAALLQQPRFEESARWKENDTLQIQLEQRRTVNRLALGLCQRLEPLAAGNPLGLDTIMARLDGAISEEAFRVQEEEGVGA